MRFKSTLYRVFRENFDTAHRKVDGIENIKVSYRLAIFAIIIEILIFEVVLIRARQEKCFSHSRYSPAQFIKHWLPAAHWRGEKGSAPSSPLPRLAAPRGRTRVDGRYVQLRL